MTKNENIDVSIIIPIYNSEPYLRKCLESLVNNTFSGVLEIICINDNSTDDSRIILNDYSKQDERIIVVDNDRNYGTSHTRNVGISIARGKYVWFVDPDDWVAIDSLCRLYETAEDNKLDILCFDAEFLYEDESQMKRGKDKAFHFNRICTGVEAIKKQGINGKCDCYVWSKFFLRSFLIENDIVFDELMSVSEDVKFSYKALLSAKRVMPIDEKLYNYYRHSNSSVTLYHYTFSGVFSQCILLDFFYCILSESSDEELQDVILLLFKRRKKMLEKRYLKTDSVDRTKWNSMDYRRLYFDFLNTPYYRFFPRKLSPEVMSIIRKSSEIMIYGAGNVGLSLASLLDERGIAYTCFIESLPEKKSVNGHTVRSLESLTDNVNSLILVAVHDRTQQKIIEMNLIERGFSKSQILLYDDIK